MPHPSAETDSHSTPCTLDDYNVEAYDYALPNHLVATHPLPQRDASRMMWIQGGAERWEHQMFRDIAQHFNAGDVLVRNNTQVLPARFRGHRRGANGEHYEGQCEMLLLHPTSQAEHEWHCLMKPARKFRVGSHLCTTGGSTLEVLEQGEAGHGKVKVHLNGVADIETLMQQAGEMPIPPYFNRAAEEADKERYQTVYASIQGSQAAPTAGLHFTPEVLHQLEAKGVRIVDVTLSVGVGTFRPVMVQDVREHDMHGEAYTLPQKTVDAIRTAKAEGKRVIAVGTTSVKTLETAARNQGGLPHIAESGWSDLYIYPGFQFQVVDAMLTNFHLPKSTLLMMISAFANRPFILRAYEEAVREQYRFYSYGDCMLLERALHQ
jgi:S-adenosylmethionine:tRNA ribosyltransferase-isomerase